MQTNFDWLVTTQAVCRALELPKIDRKTLTDDITIDLDKGVVHSLLQGLAHINVVGEEVNVPQSQLEKVDILPFVILCEEHALVVASNDNHQLSAINEEGEVQACEPNELPSNYTGKILVLKEKEEQRARGFNPFGDDKANWFWQAFRKCIPLYREVLLAALLVNIFALASPLFIMNVYDRVVPNSAYHTLWVLASGMLLVVSFDWLMKKLKNDFIDTAAKRIDISLSTTTFKHVMGIRMDSRSQSVGGLANVLQSFESIRDFITSATMSVLVDIPFVILFLLLIYLFAGPLVFVPIVAIVISLAISLSIQPPLKRIIGQYYKESGEKQALLIESLSSVETVKALNVMRPFYSRWQKAAQTGADLGVRMRNLSSSALATTASLTQLATVCIVIGGVYRINLGLMSVGALIACTILTGRTLAPISQVAGLFTRLQQAKSAYQGLNQTMQLPTEQQETGEAIHLTELTGKIIFRDVKFSYPNSKVSVLKNISTTMKPGDRIGIIGGPGSGKTTFVKLLMKLYNPTDGQILIDDLEIRQIDTISYRRLIGYVPQDVVLFHGTIKDNITLGEVDVSDEELMRAAKLSNLMPYIQAHPDGFNWEIVERGQNISGGQRQAVALARALLFNPPLLLFDEPMSNLDDSTIRKLLANLETVLPGKTFVVVSHKLNVLNLADRLLVFSNGALVADDTKQAVLEQLKVPMPQAAVSKSHASENK